MLSVNSTEQGYIAINIIQMEILRSTSERISANSRGFCDDLCGDKTPKNQIRQQLDLSKQKERKSGQLQPIIFQQPPKEQSPQGDDSKQRHNDDYDSEHIQIAKHPAHLLFGAEDDQKSNALNAHNDDTQYQLEEVKPKEYLTSTLKLEDIVVMHQNRKLEGTPDKLQSKELLAVPFSVIDLGMDPTLKQMINLHDKAILESYRDSSKPSFKSWKLHPKGYYINYSKESSGIRSVLTDKSFFEGNYLNQPSIQKHYTIAHGFGLYITKSYIYRGEFHKDKAHGKGRCNQKDQKTGLTHQGEWKDGSIVKGKIDNATISYYGEMEDGVPNGKGKLRLKDMMVIYQGRFNQGIMEDSKATYQCPNYIYVGSFVAGKKHGQGTLRQKQRDTKKSQGKNKYRPPKVYEGMWEDDYFMGEQLK